MCKRSFYCEFKVSNFTWWTKIHSFILPKRKGAKKTNNDLQTTTQKPKQHEPPKNWEGTQVL